MNMYIVVESTGPIDAFPSSVWSSEFDAFNEADRLSCLFPEEEVEFWVLPLPVNQPGDVTVTPKSDRFQSATGEQA